MCKEVSKELQYVMYDVECDNTRISKMSDVQKDMIDTTLNETKEKIDECINLMQTLLGDCAYVDNLTQVQHHLGQIQIDVFDATTDIMR